MPFDPNQFREGDSYDGVITAAKMVESATGTPGLYLRADTVDGGIDGTLHITTNTRERFEKTMNDLGVSTAMLATDAFWEDPGAVLIDTECSIVPEINEYQGNESWRVKWWNAPRKVASATAKQKAANLFRQAAAGESLAFANDAPLPDIKVPF